jgi:hypothetical protein
LRASPHVAKPRVAVYGLTTEGYRLAAEMVGRADVAVVDETLQMALDISPGFMAKNPNLAELMSQEPLLSFKPLELVLGGSQVVIFAPKLRRPSEESLVEANTKMRELSRYLTKDVVLANVLPTGPGGNSENIMLVEKQTGLKVGDSLTYAYMPIKPGESKPSIVSIAGQKGEPVLAELGFSKNSQNVLSAELEYASTVLAGAMSAVTLIELAKKAREAKVNIRVDQEMFIQDFAKYIYDLKAIQASEEAGESIAYLAGATVKSLENFVRYVVDETRELLKERDLKASRTKICLLWNLDSYEMRADRIQMAESIQQRLRDYVTDVEIVKSPRTGGESDFFDSLKHNVVVVCSRADLETLKQLKRGHREAETTVILATPSLRRE